MRELTSNTALVFMAVGFTSFWILLWLIGLGPMTEVASALVLGIAVAVLLTWTPATVRSLKHGGEGESLLAIGVTMMAGVVLMQRLWIMALRYLDRPAWMLESPASAFIAWTIFCAFGLVLIAPGTTQGDVPVQNWIYLAGASTFGGVVAGLTIGAFLFGG